MWCILLETNSSTCTKNIEQQALEWEKESGIEVIVAKHSNVTGMKKYPVGRASLHLLKPNPPQDVIGKRDYNKYSTNALQYAAHLFAIYQRACELETEAEE